MDKRLALRIFVSLAAIALLGAIVWASAAPNADAVRNLKMAVDDEPFQGFQGRVYEGDVGDESRPLEGVTVDLYCSNQEE